MPLFPGAGRNHIGMAGKTQDRSGLSPPGPEVVDLSKGQALDIKATGFQTLDHHLLAAGIIGGD